MYTLHNAIRVTPQCWVLELLSVLLGCLATLDWLEMRQIRCVQSTSGGTFTASRRECTVKCMFCLVLSGLDMCITYILIWYIHIYVLYEIAPSNALLQRRHMTTHFSASLFYLFLFFEFLMFDAFLVYPLLPLSIIFQLILPKRFVWNTNCLHIFLFYTTLYP